MLAQALALASPRVPLGLVLVFVLFVLVVLGSHCVGSRKRRCFDANVGNLDARSSHVDRHGGGGQKGIKQCDAADHRASSESSTA